MARNKRRQNSRPRRNVPKKRTARAISRALTLSPRRSRAPVDPPPVKAQFRFSGILPLQVIVTASNNTAPISGFHPGLCHINCNHDSSIKPTTLRATSLSWANLWYALQSTFGFLGNQQSETYEMAIHRVVYWGPAFSSVISSHSVGSGTSSSPVVDLQGASTVVTPEIMLSVDSGDPYSRFTIRDVGTASRRACCSITLPYTAWASCSSTAAPVMIVPDPSGNGYVNTDLQDGFEVGTVHISFTIVANDLPTSPLEGTAGEKTPPDKNPRRHR